MGTGFKRDIGGGAACSLPRLCQRHRFGMGAPARLCPATTDDTPKARLQHDLHDAMRARDTVRSGTLRMTLTAITNAEVAGDEAAVDVADARWVEARLGDLEGHAEDLPLLRGRRGLGGQRQRQGCGAGEDRTSLHGAVVQIKWPPWNRLRRATSGAP